MNFNTRKWIIEKLIIFSFFCFWIISFSHLPNSRYTTTSEYVGLQWPLTSKFIQFSLRSKCNFVPNLTKIHPSIIEQLCSWDFSSQWPWPLTSIQSIFTFYMTDIRTWLDIHGALKIIIFEAAAIEVIALDWRQWTKVIRLQSLCCFSANLHLAEVQLSNKLYAF